MDRHQKVIGGNLNLCLIGSDASILEAALKLETNLQGLLIILDEKGGLLGVVSDGDIRRGLLSGNNSNDSIRNIINYNPLVITPNVSREIVFDIMRANKMQQIPIVDSEGKVIGLHLMVPSQCDTKLNNLFVVMAGGKGERLMPHTKNCPKPMLHINGKPMLEHILDRAKSEGFHRFIFSINYLGDMIKDYFGSGDKFGVQIDYVEEKRPLGTAGSLSLIKSIISDPIIVTNGDVLTDMSYRSILDFHIQNDSAATMAVRIAEHRSEYGIVTLNGINIENFVEKPVQRVHLNAGVYCLNSDVLKELNPKEACDMPDLFLRLKSKQKNITAFPMHEKWMDVGRPIDFQNADTMVSK